MSGDHANPEIPPPSRQHRGATSQVTFVSAEVPIRTATVAALGRNLDRRLYLVMNNDLLAPPYAPIRPRIGDIGSATVSALIRGSGMGDLYKLYLISERDDVEFNVGWIPVARHLRRPAYCLIWECS